MAFWGTEVTPSKPYTLQLLDERGRLHLSQATLGSGSSTKKSVLQCKMGKIMKPVYLCSLLPDKMETCALNLEFDEEDEVVFSVLGPHSIHLSGFFHGGSTDDLIRDDYGSDSYGEDFSGSESDESTDFDSEDACEDDLLDDMDMYPSSPVPNSGVVIEEILDDDKPANNGFSEKGKKKSKSSAPNSERQLVAISNAGDRILESEDEDGFPVPSDSKNKTDASRTKEKLNEGKRSEEEAKKKKTKDESSLRSLKRKAGAVVEETEHKSENGQLPGSSDALISKTDFKEKKMKRKKAKSTEEETRDVDTGLTNNKTSEESHQKISAEKDVDADVHSGFKEKKKNNKKKKNKNKNKKQESGADTIVEQAVPSKNESPKVKEETKIKPNQVRTFPNGLVIEEVAMGRPAGKKASLGKKVSVHYIGKLKKNGEIFDSNIGRAPFKFRLGIGQVIKGWDVGVNGMRVGDKRRLTIPPAMGYGTQGAGKAIPPNSWLVFDVELVDVN